MNEEQFKTELEREYSLRFSARQKYRNEVWQLLTAEFFQRYIPPASTVLDLGCGWGEFINNIRAAKKYGMDLNPEGRQRLLPEVEFLEQDCSKTWGVPDHSLDFVFTSNFFEHLRSKDDLRLTLGEAHRCLKPGGSIICLGPNLRYLGGKYWDFWDHYLALTDLSVQEVLELLHFRVIENIPRFLPYTMARGSQPPLALLRLFLKLPSLWWTIGRQFLVIARTGTVAR